MKLPQRRLCLFCPWKSLQFDSALNSKVCWFFVWLFETQWTVARQAPLSMGFSRQEYWSGLPFPSPGALPNPGIEPGSPALYMDSLPFSHQGTQRWTGWGLSKPSQSGWCETWIKMETFLWFFFHLFTYLESLAFLLNSSASGTSLVVQWLRLCPSTAGGMSSIPAQGTKIPHATWWPKQTNKQNADSYQEVSLWDYI